MEKSIRQSHRNWLANKIVCGGVEEIEKDEL